MAKPSLITKSSKRQDFLNGFRAMMPFWLGAVPFALAYTLAAKKAGLNGLEIQLMSLLLGSATVQVSLVNFIASQAPVWLVFLTAFVLSAQLILYGMLLQQRLKFPRRKTWLVGGLLTDAAYALTLNGEKSGAFLLGAELSMYFIWNFGTFAGILLQAILGTNVGGTGLEFIFPLMFLVVLVPLVRERKVLCAVGVAVVVAWSGGLFLPSGLNILLTALVSGLVGMVLTPLPSPKAL